MARLGVRQRDILRHLSEDGYQSSTRKDIELDLGIAGSIVYKSLLALWYRGLVKEINNEYRLTDTGWEWVNNDKQQR